MFSRFYIFILIFSGLFVFCSVGADQLSNAQAKLQKLTAEIDEIEQNIAKYQHDQDTLSQDMRKLDLQIGQLHNDIRALNERLASAEGRSRQLTAEQQELTAELTDQAAAFKQQARMAYITQQQSKWKLMLAQDSLQEAGRVAVMYDYINKARLQQIQTLSQLAERIQHNQTELTAEQARMQRLVSQQIEQKVVLKRAHGNKKKAQQALAQLIDQDESRLRGARENQKAIKKLLSKLQNKSAVGNGVFASQKGRLAWPVSGKLLNRYGSAKNGNSKIAWDGVAIKAPRGSDIRAIYPGTVVFSDWFQGYGWLLIVDHGDEFMSLYAHAEALHKNVGDAVKKGEKIAQVGDSGGIPQPSLYFEIRRQGIPVNPADWCTAPKLAYSS